MGWLRAGIAALGAMILTCGLCFIVPWALKEGLVAILASGSMVFALSMPTHKKGAVQRWRASLAATGAAILAMAVGFLFGHKEAVALLLAIGAGMMLFALCVPTDKSKTD